MRATARQAFTLIEVLVALAVLGLVLVIVHRVLISSISVAEWRERRCLVAAEAGALLRRVETDVRGLSQNWSALRSPRTHPRGRQTEGQGQNEPLPDPPFFLDRSGDSDTVRMLTTGPSLLAEAGTGTLRLVEYRVRHRSRGNTLVRSERPVSQGRSTDEREAETPEVELGQNVECFDVRCFDGKEWLDNWNDESPVYMPAAVEIRIRIAEPGGGKARETRSAEVRSVVAVRAWSDECVPKAEDTGESERKSRGGRR